MEQFIIMLSEKRKGELKAELLQKHIAHLKELKLQDKLVLCGPFSNNDGAIKIIRASNMDEAELVAKQDPFTINNYYQSYKIFQLIEANENNNYLLEDTQTKINQRLIKD